MMHREDLLRALADEVGDLGRAASRLQAALGDILQNLAGAGLGSSGLWHLQEIDRLQQTLDDLAAILRHAAESEGTRIAVEDIVAVTRLGSLRERLRLCGARTEGQEAGIVAIF